jgi:hypothetical protein
MKWPAKVLVALFAVAMIASAQSSTEDRGLAQETQVRGYWVDPSTGLMWAGKDNGKDLNWHKAMNYCRDLRLAGYSDWRLATIDELQEIYDKSANAPGLAGKHGDEPFAFHVKGNLFLTGAQWSSSQRIDDRGRPNGYVWYFNFNEGRRVNDQSGYFTNKHALCVRRSGK